MTPTVNGVIRMCRVLIVEDEILIRKYIVDMLESMNCVIAGESSTGENAVSLSKKEKPDLVLMDIRLAGKLNGIQAAKQISDLYGTPIIFMSAYEYENNPEYAEIKSFQGYLSKPVESHDIEPYIKRIRGGN